MHHTSDSAAIGPLRLAQAYDAFISARWRGDDECADAGTAWFEAHWSGQAPPEPEGPPEAASVLGAAGHGIRWYARGGLVLGYAGEQATGCYQIAEDEALPASSPPWRSPLNLPASDRVLNHGGAPSSRGDGLEARGALVIPGTTGKPVRPRTLDEIVLDERVGRALHKTNHRNSD